MNFGDNHQQGHYIANPIGVSKIRLEYQKNNTIIKNKQNQLLKSIRRKSRLSKGYFHTVGAMVTAASLPQPIPSRTGSNRDK